MSNPSLQANFSANTAGFTQGTSVLKQKLNELNTQMEQTKQAVKEANTQVREYQKELTQLKAATDNGSKATEDQKNRMQQLRDRIAQTTSGLGTLRTTEQDLRTQIRNVNSELQNQETTLQSVTSNVSNMGEVLKANLWSSAIQSAVSKLTSALQTAASYCYSVGSSFESGMSQVAAISGATAEELEQLTAKAKELGASTKFTATEVASAMNYMAMAGWNAQQMYDGIDGVISLAAASGGDLATTADIVTDAITAFGLSADDVQHFSDVLAAASASANTNVSMMGESFKYVAPLAGTLGYSIDDVSEALGIMADSGVKASSAGTYLRSILTSLASGVTLTADAFGTLEIKASNDDGTMKSLNEVLGELRERFSEMTEEEKVANAEAISGDRAMSGLLPLMNAGEEEIDKVRTAIENCDGAAASMADTMQNNTAGAVTIMQSALEGLGIAVYDKFGDQLKDKINEFTDVFSNLTEQIENGEMDEVFESVAESVGEAADQLVELAQDALPGMIEGVANIITFLVKYRAVIMSVVAAWVSYKSASAVTQTLTSLVTSIAKIITALTAEKAAHEAAANATEKQTAAQAVNNAVAAANPYIAVATALLTLVSAIATFIAVSNTATASTKSFREEADEATQSVSELNQTAEKSDKAAKSVRELTEEYKNIEEASDDAKDSKDRLKEIQDTLIDTYGAEADKLDLVNGKYGEQLELLNDISDAKSETAKIDAAAAYRAAQDAMSSDTEYTVGTFNETQDQYKQWGIFAQLENSGKVSWKEERDDYDNAKYSFRFDSSMSYEDRVRFLTDYANALEDKIGSLEDWEVGTYADYSYRNSLRAINSALQDNINAMEEYNEAQERYNYYYGDDTDESGGDDGGNDSSDKSGDNDGVDWTNYNSIKKYYKYLLDTEQIGSDQYYNQIEYFANKLFDRDTDDWRSEMAEIYQGRKKSESGSSSSSSSSGKDPNEEAYDSEQKYLKWKYDMGYITEEEYYSQLAQLRDKYLDESSDKWRSAALSIHKYQVSQQKSALDEIKSQYDNAISAIDDEIKQHERDREDEDLDKQIADVDRQLEYDRLDDYSRWQLEQKKQELLDEKEETEWQRSKEDEKAALDTVYTMAKEAYDSGSADLEKALQTASLVFQAIGTGAQNTASAVSTVTNYNSLSFAMSAVNQTADQIANAVIKAISSSI